MRMFDEIKTRIYHSNVRPEPQPLPSFEHIETAEMVKETFNQQYLTEFSVTWKIAGYWTSNPNAENSKDLMALRKNFVEQLRKGLYGELQERLLKLQRQLYEHPTAVTDEDLMSTFRDIMGEVWGSGPI